MNETKVTELQATVEPEMLTSVSRETVLKAIREEPLLAPGMWVQQPLLQVVGTCQVCLVGATLRQAGCTNRRIAATVARARVVGLAGLHRCLCGQPRGRHTFDCDDLLTEVDYHLGRREDLSALSVLFEGTAFLMDTVLNNGCDVLLDGVPASYREELAAVVTARFPEVLNIA